MIRRYGPRGLLGLLALATALYVSAPAAADVVIFKDGFMLYGKVSRDGETITDPGGQAFTIPTGPFFILDGARRVYFSHAHVAKANNKDVFEGAEIVKLERRVSRLNAQPMPPLIDLREVSDWNDRWERKYTIGYQLGKKTWVTDIDQRLTQLTPQFARVDALKFNWTAFYNTNELGGETVRRLLNQHPDMTERGGKSEAARRFRIYRFLMQAGWYDLAEAELDDLVKVVPSEKDKVAEARKHLTKVKAIQQLEEIERGEKVGRHRWVQQQLATLPREALEDQLAGRARVLAERYEQSAELQKQARRFLKELLSRIAIPEQQKFFADFVETIFEDVNFDTAERLEVFVKLSQQAERDRTANRVPENTPAQLMALAVTGWTLGKDSADVKFEVARRLWRARQFAEDYLKAENTDARARALRIYQSFKDETPVDELLQIIRTLPPVEADAEIKGEVLERSAKFNRRKGIAYSVQLPSEYTTTRSYPVVIALGHGKESPKDAIARCSAQATRYGCILVAPNWNGDNGDMYRYTPEEHAAVTDVLRDVRRRYQVDSDRVFLIGFGEGASMAWDVGLAHPDLFAGVAPISGSIKLFPRAYAENGQNLPFYVVHGSGAGDFTKQNMQQAEKMVKWNFPVIHVVYKGRGMEFYEGELPNIFEWMSHKPRRSSGFPVLGEKKDFVTSREGDNHFYWISTDSIQAGSLSNPANFRLGSEAHFTARIGEANQINITSKGLNQITIWLGKDSEGREMIDFTKPVNVRWNGNLVLRNVKATPNIATLLDDIALRGDRQQPFMAKLDMGK